MSFSFADTMGEILNATVKNFSGDDAVIKIYKKDYAGASTELTHTSKLDLQYVGEDIEYKPIRQRKLTWEFSVPNQTILDIIEDIFLQEERTYMGTLTVGGADKFAGVAIVDEFKHPDRTFPLPLQIIISDLAGLKKFDATTDSGRDTIMAFLSGGLQNSGLLLNINTVNEYYPGGGSTGDGDDSLITNTFDPLCFKDIEKNETMKSYESIETILKPFTLELFQKDGEWWILQMPKLIDSSYRVRTYDYQGSFQSAEASHDPELNSGTDIKLLSDNIKHLNPGYKKIMIVYKHGDLKNAILPNWNYATPFTGIPDYWEAVDTGLGDPSPFEKSIIPGYFAFRMNGHNTQTSYLDDFSIANVLDSGGKNDSGYINMGGDIYNLKISLAAKVRALGSTGSFFYFATVIIKVGSYYLKKDGTWTLTNNAIGMKLYNNQRNVLEIETDDIPADGQVEVQLGVPIKIGATTYSQDILWDPVVTELIRDDGNNESNSSERVFAVESDLISDEEFDLEISKIGSGPAAALPGALELGGNFGHDWVSSLDSSGLRINVLSITNLLRLLESPRKKFDLNFLGSMDISNVFVRDSERFRVLDTTWDIIRDQSKAILLELKDAGTSSTNLIESRTINPAPNLISNSFVQLPPSTNGFVVSDNSVYPYLIISGTDENRTINVLILKFNDDAPSNLRSLVHWWISNSEYGSPIALGSAQTLTFVKGNEIEIGRYPDGQLNSSLTDENGELEINLTNALSTPGTRYFHAEIQGQIQVISFTINVT